MQKILTKFILMVVPVIKLRIQVYYLNIVKKKKHKKQKTVGLCRKSPQLGFPGGSADKESTCRWETWVQSLGWKDLLEKATATHSGTLAWRISWTIQSMRLQRVGHD